MEKDIIEILVNKRTRELAIYIPATGKYELKLGKELSEEELAEYVPTGQISLDKVLFAKRMAEQTIEKLKEIKTISNIELVKLEIINNNILWTQFLLDDGDILPIKIDLLNDLFSRQTKNIYLSPGTALNIQTNFITPKNKNLAVFLANKHYLVIGISPREDNAPANFNFDLIKDWGFEKHTQDFSEIVDIFQRIWDRDFDVLGHSAGALVVLNYSSTPSYISSTTSNKLKTVRVIDEVGQYPLNSTGFQNSQASLNAANQLIANGTFVDNTFLGFVFLAQQAKTNPTGDSGVPRPAGDNFTNEGLLFFSLINTAFLPGLLTPITGLPSFWYLKQGFNSGTYEFGPTPLEDKYALLHTNIQTIFDALSSIGSGTYPIAYDRAFYALRINQFPLNWGNIKVPVFWINTELGFGDASFTISLLKTQTTYDVVKNYGHADPVYSDTADIDFWPKLFP